MTETTVSADLLEAFEIITELRVDTVGQNLRVLAIDDIALSVHEPGWNLAIFSRRVSDRSRKCAIEQCESAGCVVDRSRFVRTIDLGSG